MLILSRTVGESIKIGDDIEVTIITKHNAHSIELGIQAPEEAIIYRGEDGFKAKKSRLKRMLSQLKGLFLCRR